MDPKQFPLLDVVQKVTNLSPFQMEEVVVPDGQQIEVALSELSWDTCKKRLAQDSKLKLTAY